MPPAPLPKDEKARLAALQSYGVLDVPPEKNLDGLVALAARLLGTPMAAVSLVDETRQCLVARFGVDVEETPREQSFCAHAILDPGRPLVVEDAETDPRFADNLLVTGPFHLRFYAGVPLVTPEGHAIGSLCTLDTVPRQMTADQLANLADIARAVTTTLELRRVAEENRRLALTDPLTGLPNRTALMDTLTREIARQGRERGRFGLLCLDLDSFKTLNDSHGHATGDEALREVAAALREGLRRGDLPARMGGDEFCVLLACSEPDRVQGRVERVAERVRRLIGERMAARGWAVTASVGAVAFMRPPASATAALTLGDRLLYEAKAAGRDRVVGHRPELRIVTTRTG
ncbi:MAG TPA: sensor domain-containing diguanylate cyclase [Acetobacteraceae bacterium]|jgi:diguanylate cyclase (GGDEF)-like protein|nr:sensor domain-containing diguanylate cyclase [Acetobacteraceae bacterium]